MKRKKQGFTLIELIIVIALMGVVMSAAFSLMQFSSMSFTLSVKEYNEQAGIRLALEKVNSAVRYSNAVFTIPETSFRQDNLTANWNYIGIQDMEITPAEGENAAVTGKAIVQYIYDPETGTHNAAVILPPQADLIYKIIFQKTVSGELNNLLEFTIQSYDKVTNNQRVTIRSQLEALNSLQVVDFGTALDPAVAIAYRYDERLSNVVGHVAMVLDTSGSMEWNMQGETINGKGQGGTSRIEILKSEATKLINGLAQEDNIDIALVPFDTSANDPMPFRNAREDSEDLIDDIDNFRAGGGTNTGDGIRRAYKALLSHTPPSGIRASNYVIILVDGVTTFASVISNSNRNYFTGTGNVDEGYLDRDPYSTRYGQIAGNGSELDAKGEGYVTQMGNFIRSNGFAKAYVIGFSSLDSDLRSIENIAEACGADAADVFTAGSSDELNRVLTEIGQDIVNDMWYLQGPEL